MKYSDLNLNIWLYNQSKTLLLSFHSSFHSGTDATQIQAGLCDPPSDRLFDKRSQSQKYTRPCYTHDERLPESVWRLTVVPVFSPPASHAWLRREEWPHSCLEKQLSQHRNCHHSTYWLLSHLLCVLKPWIKGTFWSQSIPLPSNLFTFFCRSVVSAPTGMNDTSPSIAKSGNRPGAYLQESLNEADRDAKCHSSLVSVRWRVKVSSGVSSEEGGTR